MFLFRLSIHGVLSCFCIVSCRTLQYRLDCLLLNRMYTCHVVELSRHATLVRASCAEVVAALVPRSLIQASNGARISD